MANITVKYFSNCLMRQTTFEMYLPNDLRDDMPSDQQDNPYRKRPTKTLFLLHGYTGSAGNFVPEWLSEQYNFAVIAPNGENSFWLDGISTGHKFCSLLGDEMLGYVRNTFGLAKSAEDTFIMGMSMGGFGALHTGLAYPDRFGKIGAMSSALIVHEVAGMEPGTDNGVANYEYYRECFGEPAWYWKVTTTQKRLSTSSSRKTKRFLRSICAAARRIFCWKTTGNSTVSWKAGMSPTNILRAVEIMTCSSGASTRKTS